jgi:hypothetical protein
MPERCEDQNELDAFSEAARVRRLLRMAGRGGLT